MYIANLDWIIPLYGSKERLKTPAVGDFHETAAGNVNDRESCSMLGVASPIS